MATKANGYSVGRNRHGVRKIALVRPGGIGARLAGHAVPALFAVTTAIALIGGFVAFRVVSDDSNNQRADGRVPTSFGALWVESFNEIAVPKIEHRGMFAFPQDGPPEKVSLDVVVGLANTTRAAVELTPALFALRLGPDGKPILVEGAAFDSVNLLPGNIYDARLQFPVDGGEHQLTLLFEDPDGTGPIAIDLGQARFQDAADEGHDH